MSTQVKTRFLLLSDTHSSGPRGASITRHPELWPFPTADVAIHTGDLTLTGKRHEHEQAFELLTQLGADLKIVIPGNHDLTLDTAYYNEKGHIHGPLPKYTVTELDDIRSLYTGPRAQAANIVYLEEGTRSCALPNGATLTIYASAYTPEFCQWAFAYPRSEDRFNAAEAQNVVPTYSPTTNTNVDVMLTHGPPWGVLDAVQRPGSDTNVHVGCEHLLRAVARARPLMHCFGHIHEGWGAVRKTWSAETDASKMSSQDLAAGYMPVEMDEEKTRRDSGVLVDGADVARGRETLFVNASIMDLRYKPTQAPWVVDLMLERLAQ